MRFVATLQRPLSQLADPPSLCVALAVPLEEETLAAAGAAAASAATATEAASAAAAAVTTETATGSAAEASSAAAAVAAGAMPPPKHRHNLSVNPGTFHLQEASPAPALPARGVPQRRGRRHDSSDSTQPTYFFDVLQSLAAGDPELREALNLDGRRYVVIKTAYNERATEHKRTDYSVMNMFAKWPTKALVGSIARSGAHHDNSDLDLNQQVWEARRDLGRSVIYMHVFDGLAKMTQGDTVPEHTADPSLFASRQSTTEHRIMSKAQLARMKAMSGKYDLFFSFGVDTAGILHIIMIKSRNMGKVSSHVYALDQVVYPLRKHHGDRGAGAFCAFLDCGTVPKYTRKQVEGDQPPALFKLFMVMDLPKGHGREGRVAGVAGEIMPNPDNLGGHQTCARCSWACSAWTGPSHITWARWCRASLARWECVASRAACRWGIV